jgi:hypothetical protein
VTKEVPKRVRYFPSLAHRAVKLELVSIYQHDVDHAKAPEHTRPWGRRRGMIHTLTLGSEAHTHTTRHVGLNVGCICGTI